MSIQGNLVPNVLRLPLRGRVAVAIDFSPVDIASKVVSFVVYDDDGSDTAIVTHDDTDKKTTATAILIEMTDEEAALFSSQRLRPFLITISDESTGQAVYSMMGYVLPVSNATYGTFAITTMQPNLSTTTINRLVITAYSGNVSGSLDYLITATKSVGIIVQFILSPGGQPEQWVLEAGTQATVAGEYQRPNDFNASTNAKVWRRCM